MQGLKVGSRNSYLLYINPGLEPGDFQTTFPYLAALAGRPLASGVRTPQRKRLVCQLELIKRARLAAVTDFNLLRIRSASLLCEAARPYLAAEAIIAQGANTRPAGVSPKPLWSLNWLVKLPFGEYPVSKQATPQFIPFRLQSGESSIAPLCSHE